MSGRRGGHNRKFLAEHVCDGTFRPDRHLRMIVDGDWSTRYLALKLPEGDELREWLLGVDRLMVRAARGDAAAVFWLRRRLAERGPFREELELALMEAEEA